MARIQYDDETTARSLVGPLRGGAVAAGSYTVLEVCPSDFTLWLVVITLEDGASIEWATKHGDEVVYVREGLLDVAGRRCPEGGAVVVEADAAATVLAVGRTVVVHMGPTDPVPPVDGLNGPAQPDQHDVHVVGPGGTYARVGEDRDTWYYADSTCPTCRATLLYVAHDGDFEAAADSHSEDELIHVIKGEIVVGQRRLHPGATMSVLHDTRYRYRSGPDGYAFINYRRDASTQYLVASDTSRMEGGAVNGLTAVMDLR